MNKLKLLTGLIRKYQVHQLLGYYFFNKSKYYLFNLKNKKSYLIRSKSRDFNTINENEIEENYDAYLKLLKNPKIIIDIGANIGCFSVDCSKMFKNCKIYAYEPFEESLEILNINLKLNNIENVKTFCKAVTKSLGSSELGIYKGMYEANSIGDIWGKPDSKIKINTIRLKDIFSRNNIKYCDLLKLDCEGSEYEILETLGREYFKKIGNIIMEYHLGREDFLKKMLQEEGFNVKIKKFGEKSGILIANK